MKKLPFGGVLGRPGGTSGSPIPAERIGAQSDVARAEVAGAAVAGAAVAGAAVAGAAVAGAGVAEVVGVGAVGAMAGGGQPSLAVGAAAAVAGPLDDPAEVAASVFSAPGMSADAPRFGLPQWDGLPRRIGRRQRTRRSSPSATKQARPLAKPMRPILAIPVLVLLVVVGVGLVGTIGGLVGAAIYKASGASAAAAPLAGPAPATAGGFRQHYEPLQNVETLALIAEFERRFRMFSGTTTREPAGLYREPATVDLISDQPGWIKYQGYNSPASLGPPALEVGKLISDLIEASGPGTSWHVAPGARGGSARCAITTMTHIRVSICAWATPHTAGALISPDADTRGDELAVLLPLMRLDLQPG